MSTDATLPIRTWRVTPLGGTTLVTRRADGREITGAGINRTTEVIELELEPVLDLLEPAVRVWLAVAEEHGERGILEAGAAVALLREHERLA